MLTLQKKVNLPLYTISFSIQLKKSNSVVGHIVNNYSNKNLFPSKMVT